MVLMRQLLAAVHSTAYGSKTRRSLCVVISSRDLWFSD